MDLAMPKMNGLLATKEVAEHSPDTKIVILSAVVPFGDTHEDAISLGAHAVFDKYTHPKKLIKAVVGLVGR
jgi:DNA-binding NarL/FixJ family response regulator